MRFPRYATKQWAERNIANSTAPHLRSGSALYVLFAEVLTLPLPFAPCRPTSFMSPLVDLLLIWRVSIARPAGHPPVHQQNGLSNSIPAFDVTAPRCPGVGGSVARFARYLVNEKPLKMNELVPMICLPVQHFLRRMERYGRSTWHVCRCRCHDMPDDAMRSRDRTNFVLRCCLIQCTGRRR